MSMLIHDQGTNYVLMPYRERVQANSTRELKRKVRALSRQFGSFVSIHTETKGTYLVVFSDRPGVLLAELTASARPTTNAFLYVEPYDREHCLVIVIDGLDVLMDRLVRREDLLDQITPYAKRIAENVDAELLCVNGVTLSDEEKEKLGSLQISLRELPESLWRGKSSLSANASKFKLSTLNTFLGQMHTPWYRKVWFLPSLAIVSIIVLASGIHHVQSKNAPVFVRHKQLDILQDMRQYPQASEVLDRISETMIRLQGWPGVSVSKVRWEKAKLQLFVSLNDRLRHRSWRSWLLKYGFSSKEKERQAVLTKQLLLPASDNKDQLLSARQTFNDLSDAAELALGKADLTETRKEHHGRYALIDATLRIKGMSAARLSLLADSMRKQSIVLHRVTLHNREHRFSGSLLLTVWGYAS